MDSRVRACEQQVPDDLKTGMIYLAVSILIAAAAAVYGSFGHGVYSYYMTYAFMIPLLGGAVPRLLSAMSKRTQDSGGRSLAAGIFTGDVQLAVISTLTAGSLLKGALDIYGTTNRLLIAYPVMAGLILAAGLIAAVSRRRSAAQTIKNK